MKVSPWVLYAQFESFPNLSCSTALSDHEGDFRWPSRLSSGNLRVAYFWWDAFRFGGINNLSMFSPLRRKRAGEMVLTVCYVKSAPRPCSFVLSTLGETLPYAPGTLRSFFQSAHSIALTSGVCVSICSRFGESFFRDRDWCSVIPVSPLTSSASDPGVYLVNICGVELRQMIFITIIGNNAVECDYFVPSPTFRTSQVLIRFTLPTALFKLYESEK